MKKSFKNNRFPRFPVSVRSGAPVLAWKVSGSFLGSLN